MEKISPINSANPYILHKNDKNTLSFTAHWCWLVSWCPPANPKTLFSDEERDTGHEDMKLLYKIITWPTSVMSFHDLKLWSYLHLNYRFILSLVLACFCFQLYDPHPRFSHWDMGMKLPYKIITWTTSALTCHNLKLWSYLALNHRLHLLLCACPILTMLSFVSRRRHSSLSSRSLLRWSGKESFFARRRWSEKNASRGKRGSGKRWRWGSWQSSRSGHK